MCSTADAPAAAARLAAALRAEGLPIGIDAVQAFVGAAAACGDLYWAGRLTLVRRVEDLPAYDQVFGGLFTDLPDDPQEDYRSAEEHGAGDDDEGVAVGDGDDREASAIEILRRTPFDRLNDADVAALARAVDAARRRAPVHRTRRQSPSPRGRQLDLRRTLREVQRMGGDAVMPRFTRPTPRVRPVTFMVDVSGSMQAASHALLLACASFVRAHTAHDAFVFGTRLTRVAPALRTGPIDQALVRASELIEDQGGGTRIADSLQTLLDRYGPTRTVRGAVVVIYSDGLETGVPADLGRQMQRLALRAARVVWLNPLSAAPTYQPLAGGMRAALPFVDTFAAGHDLASLQTVVDQVLDKLGG